MNTKNVLVTLCFALLGATGFPRFTAAQEMPRVVLRADFETAGDEAVLAPEARTTALLTSVPDEVVSGQRSLKGDARHSTAEWNEFFHSRPGLFQPGEAYRVSFDYRVLARAEGATFYALFRGKSGDVGWKDLQGEPGTRGHAELAIFTHNAADFYLIIGIHHQGALSIDNLVIQTDPTNRPPDIHLPAPKRTWKSPGRTTYYIDAQQGNDANMGQSPQQPWRSLARVNVGEFAPGDRILLKAGCRWSGALAPGGSGTEAEPIRVDRYGSGAKPRIDGEEQTLATLYLFNVEGWEIRNLEITNQGKFRVPNLAGVLVRLEDFGTAHHIWLSGLEIHDVTGSLVKDEGGGAGISCTSGGSKLKSRFDGLQIEGCHLLRTDRNGITMNGYWARNDWYPSLHVVIRKNLLEDIGGDGIVPIGCDGTLIEHNILNGGRQRCEDYAAGIWPWSCDNTLVQYNEVSGMKGTRDGEGFDSDWNCRNTLFQYNYSHDNDGGFMLICDDGSSKPPWNIGNVGTVIRYNISQNDSEHTFNITGPCRDTLIYNNVFYIGKGKHVYAVQAGNWGGDWSEQTRFFNNIFSVEGEALFDFGGMRNTTFENNLFWGKFQDRPLDAHAITADPKFADPGSGKNGLGSLSGYRLLPDSPCIHAGKPIPNSGGRDFWGHPLPVDSPLNIGAFQEAPPSPR